MINQILDTHFHAWKAPGATYEWVDVAIARGLHFVEPATLPARYTLADYDDEWRTFGFTPFVHVEAGADPDDALIETEWLASGDTERPARLVVFADLRSPTLRAELIEQMAADTRVAGVRQIVTWSNDRAMTFVDSDVMRDPAWERGLDVVGDLRLSFDLQIYPEQAVQSARIASRHPRVRFLVDHALLPWLEDLDPWRAGLRILASTPNVAIKLGGLSMRNPVWRIRDAADLMAECIDEFGVGRAMFATNSPVETARTPSANVAEAAARILAALSASERGTLARGAALDWYPLPRVRDEDRSGVA